MTGNDELERVRSDLAVMTEHGRLAYERYLEEMAEVARLRGIIADAEQAVWEAGNYDVDQPLATRITNLASEKVNASPD